MKHTVDKDQQVTDLVDANHILFDRAVLDAFGHVSMRDQNSPEHFLLARNMAPALVTRDDIQTFTLDAETDDARPMYLERFLHSEIYKANPSVMAVVHSHSTGVLPFSFTDRPLRAVSHMAGFLGVHTPVFEIRDVAGSGSDLLIRDATLGKHLASALKDAPVLLMRGHGSVAVGSTVQQAVFRAVFTEMNARVQAEGALLGETTYLTAEEGESAAISNASQIDRAWALWRLQARANTVTVSAT
ncbi:MAG: Class aldolase/adducin-like protein [Homoserinimonas sp.]|jgi:ribulose-5-phosphate 4-epimerase/fuculose-1-phosphate aldolase|nr:Class aldolase/adducin-like protein [Homoserinimonas sp.]